MQALHNIDITMGFKPNLYYNQNAIMDIKDTVISMNQDNQRDTCLYFHINPVKGHIFYVGIGDYKRPFNRNGRREFWKKTVKKYGIIVDVVQTKLTWDEACELEMFYIKKIGRRDVYKKLGKKPTHFHGNLVNLTDGGEGNKGFIFSIEDRLKASIRNKERLKNPIELEKFLKIRKTSIENRTPEQELERVNKISKTHRDKIEKLRAEGILTNKEKKEIEYAKLSSNRDESIRIKKSIGQEKKWKNMTDDDKNKMCELISDGWRKKIEEQNNNGIFTKKQIREKAYTEFLLLSEEEKSKERSRRLKEAHSKKKEERRAKGVFTTRELRQMAFESLPEEEQLKRIEKGIKTKEGIKKAKELREQKNK